MGWGRPSLYWVTVLLPKLLIVVVYLLLLSKFLRLVFVFRDWVILLKRVPVGVLFLIPLRRPGFRRTTLLVLFLVVFWCKFRWRKLIVFLVNLVTVVLLLKMMAVPFLNNFFTNP